MRARTLAEPVPTVTLDQDAMEATRMMSGERLPGIVVVDDAGLPYTVLPGSQVLRFLIPRYMQDDPALARALSEQACEDLIANLHQHSVRDLLPKPQHRDDLPVVDGDATTIEIAAVMARVHSPIVAVVDGHRLLGAITVNRLLEQLLHRPGPA